MASFIDSTLLTPSAKCDVARDTADLNLEVMSLLKASLGNALSAHT